MTSPIRRCPRALGIAGPSCSGKSTVARLVAETLGARLLSLDSYWISGSCRPSVNGHPSYERPHQYDGAALARDAAALLADGSGHPVVLEGFLLFLYPATREICAPQVFVQVCEPTLLARRAGRAASEGRILAGGKRATVEIAWLANGLDEWRTFGAQQATMPGMKVVEGSRPPEAVARDIVELLSSAAG